MTVEECSTKQEAVLRRAAERLLAWGFTPAEVAHQLGRTAAWVDVVNQERIDPRKPNAVS